MTDTAPSQAAVDGVLAALTDVIRGANDPALREAQALLIRRLAVQGDVIPSRLPAPRNITEMGGYLNLLGELGETSMRSSMLGSTLGLATEDPLGAAQESPPMALVALDNDVPDGIVSLGVPRAFVVREDFAAGFRGALAGISTLGVRLPLWSPPPALPRRDDASAITAPPDPLLHLGREVWIAPTTALVAAATDPVVVARPTADATATPTAMLRVPATTAGATSVELTAYQWDQNSGVVIDVNIGATTTLRVGDLLSPSGFAPRQFPRPVGRGDYRWARLVNVTGLVPGVSRLGDELLFVHSPSDVAASVYAGSRGFVWDGDAFVSP